MVPLVSVVAVQMVSGSIVIDRTPPVTGTFPRFTNTALADEHHKYTDVAEDNDPLRSNESDCVASAG